jgi:hypothetical protein
MRKILCLIVLALGVHAVAFSFSPSESSTGLGFGWGNFFERAKEGGNTAKTYMGSPGIMLEAYQFWSGHNIGLFTNVGFLFPTKMTSDVSGVKTDVDLGIYDFLFQDNIIIGPGFRYSFDDHFTLLAGVGFDVLLSIASYSRSVYVGYGWLNNVSYAMFSLGLGIGGDVGIKFDVTDKIFLKLGSAVSYEFLNHSSISTNVSAIGNQSGWASGYSMFGFRPYLCVGLNSYVTEPGFFKTKLGKPQ